MLEGGFGTQVRESFLADLGRAREIAREVWAKRGGIQSMRALSADSSVPNHSP
jgi:hypothetical protein